MTKKKKITLTTSLLSLALITGVVSGVATYAGFSAKQLVQPSIGSKGSNANIKTIYFNAHIWDLDDPIIYMKRFDSESDLVSASMQWIPVSKEIRPEIDGTEFHFYVFQYDTSISYSKFKFVRFNPSGSPLPTSPTTDLSAEEWAKVASDTAGRSIWNYSKTITYSDDYSYYVIEGWNPSDSNSCKKNTLTYTTDWAWGGSDVPA